MILNPATYDLFAAKHYNNPQCQSTDEFQEDISRVVYVKRLLTAYLAGKGLKERLILNHVVVLYNCFGRYTADLLFFKCRGMEPQLIPFISWLSILPVMIDVNGVRVETSSFGVDEYVRERLARI